VSPGLERPSETSLNGAPADSLPAGPQGLPLSAQTSGRSDSQGPHGCPAHWPFSSRDFAATLGFLQHSCPELAEAPVCTLEGFDLTVVAMGTFNKANSVLRGSTMGPVSAGTSMTCSPSAPCVLLMECAWHTVLQPVQCSPWLYLMLGTIRSQQLLLLKAGVWLDLPGSPGPF
jgi:hypothetical protein